MNGIHHYHSLAGPFLVGVMSNLYVPMYNIYKAASTYGRSDYDDYYDDGYDRSVLKQETAS